MAGGMGRVESFAAAPRVGKSRVRGALLTQRPSGGRVGHLARRRQRRSSTAATRGEESGVREEEHCCCGDPEKGVKHASERGGSAPPGRSWVHATAATLGVKESGTCPAVVAVCP